MLRCFIWNIQNDMLILYENVWRQCWSCWYLSIFNWRPWELCLYSKTVILLFVFLRKVYDPHPLTICHCWWHTVNFSHCWFWLFRNLNHFYLVLVNIPTDQYLLKKKTIRRERTRLHWPITDYRYLVRISVGKVRNWGYLIKGTMVADKDVELRNLRTMVLLFQFLGEVEDI